MLVFDHVSVFYGGTQVLRELSFSIQDGEQAGLIGANGAGKSTLMKAALGLVPYTGSITVDGLPVTRENLPAVRRKLGYVLQDADNQMFMPTVLDDMLFGPMNYGLSREEAERQADETLASLRMEHLKLRHNHKMSGGEKRMAAVAAILAMKPDTLLMDEPSTALDPRNRRTLIRVLRARPETKLIASHDLDLVLETCRRVLLIADGTLAADGPARELLRDKALLEANGLELPLCLAGVPELRILHCRAAYSIMGVSGKKKEIRGFRKDCVIYGSCRIKGPRKSAARRRYFSESLDDGSGRVPADRPAGVGCRRDHPRYRRAARGRPAGIRHGVYLPQAGA